MKTKIAINGFGRIGRAAFKIAFDRDDLEIVAVNDLADNEAIANLLKYDSNYGRYQHMVEFTEDHFTVNGKEVKSFREKDPSKLPWKELGVEIVIESTGVFRTTEAARAHITAGARQVIMSAPAKDDETSTHVIGVNEDQLSEDNGVISNASCTTNCISPIMNILESTFGIEKALMTTIHSYTADQRLQDAPHKDPRRARAAAVNIIPTTTGAAKATGKVIPSLADNFDGMAVRVPTPTGSLSDFTVLLKKDTTVDELNELFIQSAKQPYYQGILTVSNDPIVSSDIVGDSHSAIVDLSFTKVVGGNMIKLIAWYDNEWGYANRLVELVADAGNLIRFEDENAKSDSEQEAPDSIPASLPAQEESVEATPVANQQEEWTLDEDEPVQSQVAESSTVGGEAEKLDHGAAILMDLMQPKDDNPITEAPVKENVQKEQIPVEVKETKIEISQPAEKPEEKTKAAQPQQPKEATKISVQQEDVEKPETKPVEKVASKPKKEKPKNKEDLTDLESQIRQDLGIN